MLVTIILLGCITYLLYLGSVKPKNFPPGPRKIPLLGFMPYMDMEQPHKHMMTLTKDYGPFIGVFLGRSPAVIVNSYEGIKNVLLNEDLQGRPKGTLIQDRTWGTPMGVMFTEGELWQSQRRFTLHQFRNLGFGKRSHEGLILEDVRDMVEDIKSIKGAFKLQNYLGISAVNVLWAVMGGTRFNRDNPRLQELINKIYLLFQTGKPFGNIAEIFPILKYIAPNWSGYNTIVNGFVSVNEFIMEAVEEHKKDFDENNIRDFFDAYLLELKTTEDKYFSEKQLVALSMDIFTAGVETSSSLVSFCMMYMCLYPEVQAKVQEEIDSVIGRDRQITMDDRPKLVYTDAVYTEVFRIRCPATMTVPHIAVKDTTCMGYNIPKDTLFFTNLYSVFMDDKHWGDPHTFRPERFIENGKVKKDDMFFPFGKGKRICLGESLARMTTFLSFTNLLQRFKFTLDPETPIHNTEGVSGFTLGPPDFRVHATPRY